jgi:hypothetical protein
LHEEVLVRESRDGRDAARSGLDELEEAGWLSLPRGLMLRPTALWWLAWKSWVFIVGGMGVNQPVFQKD